MSKSDKYAEFLRKRESGFNIGNVQQVKLKEYNALFDPNMKHFFENKQNQYLLYKTGQIDSHGRVIDLEKNQSKLHILEREFREAEKVEEKRHREEMEMRVRCFNSYFACFRTICCACNVTRIRRVYDVFFSAYLQYRVQRKRFNELERSKKMEVLDKLKAERELSKEIVATLRMSSGMSTGSLANTRRSQNTSSAMSVRRGGSGSGGGSGTGTPHY